MTGPQSLPDQSSGAPELRTHLERRGRRVVAIVTYALALFAWVALLQRLVPMPGSGMAMDVSAPGALEAMAIAGGIGGVVTYLVAWGVMMVAMMYPSSAGVFQWYADVRRRLHPTGARRGIVAFVGVYTLLWALVGLVPLAANALVSISSLAATWGLLYVGVAFLVVAGYQLSPLKQRYLDRCRGLSGFLVERYRPGTWGGVRMGWEFGWQDVGACGVLMGLMVAMGSMNVGWMALITVVLSVERLTDRGPELARLFGALAGIGGLALVVAWFV